MAESWGWTWVDDFEECGRLCEGRDVTVTPGVTLRGRLRGSEGDSEEDSGAELFMLERLCGLTDGRGDG